MKIKNICAFSLVSAASLSLLPAAAISFTGSGYLQDFDGLISTGQTALTATVGTPNSLGVAGWEGTKSAGTGTTLNLIANDGALNTGALYSYGTTGSTDRALGNLASAGAITTFGASFTNNTGAAIDTIYFSYTGEYWRSSTSVQNVLAFSYGLSSTGILATDYLTNASMTAFTSLNLVGPAPVTTNAALNGNDPANQILTSASISGLNWQPGDTLYIRWADANDAGNDAGLAVDNFNLSLSPVPEPGTVALIGIGLSAVLFGARRRRA